MNRLLQLSPIETFDLYNKNRHMINAYIRGDTIENLDDTDSDTGLGAAIGLFSILLLLHVIISIVLLVLLVTNYKRMKPLYWWLALFLTFFVPGGFIIGLIIIFATRGKLRK
jgi:hypothetical protein